MISFIKGEIEYIGEDFIIVENGGIGYNIKVSPMTISRLPQRGIEVKIYTFMNVKEDDISLFGFMSLEELEMFNRLITVSGVGPKGALSILAASAPSDIALAIITEDVKTLSAGQGVGKKIAQRIILELRDKINTEDAIVGHGLDMGVISEIGGEKEEALEGLIALGFSRGEAVKAINAISEDNISAGELISRALKALSR